jgi:uncharacterized protein (TIGR03437 family)
MSRRYHIILAALVSGSVLLPAAGQTMPNRYTLILEDPPVAARFPSPASRQGRESANYRTQIEGKQRALRTELAARKIQVVGSVSTVLNALFVIAPKERVAELKSLPGVKAVVPSRRFQHELNRATQLLDAPGAWNALGGIQNAGSGIKIAILDSGIDQTHPAFQDDSLPMPSGFPICNGSDCSYTNNKVIVARSYVQQLAAGTAPNPAADSRPDDYSPRDRDGHGTAVASCAAGEVNTGLVTFSGFAPKAYLGNYKIYGSPGVNDSTTDAVIIQAIEDAYNDGMDVISFSSGSPAFSGPLDSGAACGNDDGVPCDLVAQTFETLARQGLTIIAAAGNMGADGVNPNLPSYGTISSPADAPSVIAVGAATNSHAFTPVVSAADPNAPSTVQKISADPGDAFVPHGTVTGTLVDVTQLGDDGFACSPLPAASLVGAIALIERNNCSFATKTDNAENAGALGVIFYMADSSPTISPGGLSAFAIPAVMISNAAGISFKSYAESNPGSAVSIVPAGIEQDAQADEVAFFSSIGPTTGDGFLKPDLLGIGTSVYMAGENYDLAGELYSSDRYVVADGTSFSTPMVAGAAALVKQQHPAFTAAQVKAALSNTAAASVQTDDGGNPVDVRSTGSGLLDAGASVTTTVTAVPSNISFGVVTSQSLGNNQQLQVTNAGAGPVNLNIAVSATVPSPNASVQLDRSSLALNPGASGTVNVSLRGSLPPAGSYSGVITLQGDGVSLRVPYLYLVGNGSAANLIPLTGASFDGTVGGAIPDGIISFKLVDPYGVPVTGAPVRFTARGGTIQNADSVTDQYGIAAAVPVLGPSPGDVLFTATAGGLRAQFSGFARPQPTIDDGGILDAANSSPSTAVAPGSYIVITGSGLSDFTDYAESAILPLAIDQAFVSFDVPSAGISVPGHLTFASPNQLIVQVPWELQGQSSALVKVTIDYSTGNVVTVPLSDYSPAVFQGSSITPAARNLSGAPISSNNPAVRGQDIQVFANGLGPLTNQPASGEPATASPLATTTTVPLVSIGNQQASVSSSSLAPGLAGVYQVTVTVPTNLDPGMQPVVIAIGGKTSSPVNIPVQ